MSVETGKTAHQVVAVRHSPGAAGTVVWNLGRFGRRASSIAVGLTGDDGEGYELRRDLAPGLPHTITSSITAHDATYLKPRDRGDPSLDGRAHALRPTNRTPTSAGRASSDRSLVGGIAAELDALIAMDQVYEADCGRSPAVREFLAAAAPRALPLALQCGRVVFWADSRRRIHQFRRVITKPNQFEAVGRPEPGPDDEVTLEELCGRAAWPAAADRGPVCATRGARVWSFSTIKSR